MGHHLGHGWGIIWGIVLGMSGASCGACLGWLLACWGLDSQVPQSDWGWDHCWHFYLNVVVVHCIVLVAAVLAPTIEDAPDDDHDGHSHDDHTVILCTMLSDCRIGASEKLARSG